MHECVYKNKEKGREVYTTSSSGHNLMREESNSMWAGDLICNISNRIIYSGIPSKINIHNKSSQSAELLTSAKWFVNLWQWYIFITDTIHLVRPVSIYCVVKLYFPRGLSPRVRAKGRNCLKFVSLKSFLQLPTNYNIDGFMNPVQHSSFHRLEC